MKFNVCMRDCYDTCSLISEMKDGKMRVRANPENKVTSNFLCPKGALLPKWLYSKERVKNPLNRKGKKPSLSFNPTSWDNAMSIIAKKIKDTIKGYGESSVLLYYYYGDRGFVNANFPHRLFNYINASIIEDTICDRSGEEALKDIYGTSQGMDPEDVENENLIVYWGINAAWTNIHGFYLAKRLGLDIWNVDVVKTKTAKMSNKFFMIKPETDVLFALGIAKIIVERNLYDEKFVETYTRGFEDFKEYLKSIDLNFVAEESGIDIEKIEDFAVNYARERGIVHIGYGFQRTINGGEAVRAISILPALIGKKRGFIYSNRILPRNYVRGISLRKKRGYRITHMELADYIEDEKIKFVFIYGTNPFSTLPNQRKLRDAVLSSDVFIVLHDIFLTDTALFSDIFLPSNTFFERVDIADSYYHRYISFNDKLTKISGKSNSDVARMLAKAMNLKEKMLYEKDEEIIRKTLNVLGISYKRLKERGVLKIPIDSYEPKTESGKIEMSSSRAKNRGLNAFPTYMPIKGRGLKLISATYLFTISSQYHNTYGYEDTNIYLNPEDALDREIKDGAKVRVFNEYGEITTNAKISHDIQRGIALMYKAFWPMKIGWNANFLTPNKMNEKYGKGTTLHSVWVEVERI